MSVISTTITYFIANMCIDILFGRIGDNFAKVSSSIESYSQGDYFDCIIDFNGQKVKLDGCLMVAKSYRYISLLCKTYEPSISMVIMDGELVGLTFGATNKPYSEYDNPLAKYFYDELTKYS